MAPVTVRCEETRNGFALWKPASFSYDERGPGVYEDRLLDAPVRDRREPRREAKKMFPKPNPRTWTCERSKDYSIHEPTRSWAWAWVCVRCPNSFVTMVQHEVSGESSGKNSPIIPVHLSSIIHPCPPPNSPSGVRHWCSSRADTQHVLCDKIHSASKNAP